MTRAEFLRELCRRLMAEMSHEEAEQHLTYYAEMLADRMEEGMSEEEAVASLESVEVIVQRILQDRPAGEQQPSYPEPPLRGGEGPYDGGSAVPRPQRRWVLPVVLGLIGVVALAALVGPWYAWKMYDSVASANVEQVTDEGFEMVDTTEEDSLIASEEIPMDESGILYVQAGPGASSSCTVEADGICSLQVEWISGEVSIRTHQGTEVQIQETSTEKLDEATAMDCTLEGDQLTIRFSRQPLVNYRGEKHLTVLVPEDLFLEELDVDTVSGEVDLLGLHGQELGITTISGDCTLSEGQFARGEVDTTSGDARLGDITDELTFDSVSGDLQLFLPEEGDFTLTLDTVSGDLDTGDFSLRRRGEGEYICGGGSLEIQADTVSGDVTLRTA